MFLSLRYEKALARLAQGKGDDAERRIRDVIKDDPSFCAAYVALSELLRARSLDDATEVLLQGFRATRNPVFLIKLEDLCVETERVQAMIRIYSRLQQEFPSDFDVNLFMGKFFLRLEMIDEGFRNELSALPPGPTAGGTPEGEKAVIRVRGLCKSFGSGSGKSTLLRCINGLEPFQQGEIDVDGTRSIPSTVPVPPVRKRRPSAGSG